MRSKVGIISLQDFCAVNEYLSFSSVKQVCKEIKNINPFSALLRVAQENVLTIETFLGGGGVEIRPNFLSQTTYFLYLFWRVFQ